MEGRYEGVRMIRLPWYYAALICALIALSPKLYAQEPAPAPAPAPVWAHGTDEMIVDVAFQRNQLLDQWAGRLNVAWAHYITDATEIGSIASYYKDPATLDGAGVGGFYEWNAPSFRFGHVFLGGDLQYLLGDMGQQALAVAATRVGYKLHVGEDAAVRFALDFKKAVSPSTDLAQDAGQQIGFTVGVSFGMKETTTVQ
jgi:hypothetical protein